MNLWQKTILFLGIAAIPGIAVAAVTVDRDYQLGDDGAEGALAGADVGSGNGFGVTRDSVGQPGVQQLVHLTPFSNQGSLPIYATVAGRPDGGGGLAIEFDGSQQQFLRTFRLGLPETSISSTTQGGIVDYTGINDRGLQFWARPAAAGAQTLVMDTNQHGVRINEDGNYSMRYAGSDFDSGVAATNGVWQHIMVVRPLGAAGGSRMFINGVAVAAAAGGYNGDDTAELVLGSNTAGDDTNFEGATEEFYTGLLDDLEMFVIGSNDVADYGEFDFATDNDFAASVLTGVPGDVNSDGVLDDDDKTDFIDGWRNTNDVGPFLVGDINSFAAGDLNFDGITNIADLAEMQAALLDAGLGAITPADLNGVPEPSTALLVVVGCCALGWRRPR